MPDEREMSARPKPSGLAEVLGIELNEFGAGKASVECQLSELHVNQGGTAHGALLASMLDMSLGAALISTLPVEEWCSTAQLNISFLEAAKPGSKLVARGRIARRGRTLAHLEGEIVDDRGLKIASAKGVWSLWTLRTIG
jgi:uncharacterized protein (TIGR00369 family)